MTKREAAIVSAYTGVLKGSFFELKEYMDEILGCSAWTQALSGKEIWEEIKERSKKDFINIVIKEEG